jgi:eukaryotic-like serine/threonine-protein kinase
MEFEQSCDLQQMVESGGPLELRSVADFIRQAAERLDHYHKAGLIYRDVKPANLLVDQKKVVKLLDPGFAWPRFNGEEYTSFITTLNRNVLGSADYLAPEQAMDSDGVDSRADIYSLGCSLYFLLTGHPPFPNGTLPQRLMMHQNQPPTSIFKDRPDAPQALIDICFKMMAKNPDQRYQSMAEVLQALTKWLEIQDN